MTHVNSAGSRQKARASFKLAITSFDAKLGRFVSHSGTVVVHKRWAQPIIDMFCDAESQIVGLGAAQTKDGHHVFTLSGDAMRATRERFLSGDDKTICEESALDGRVKTMLREAIGHCDHMIVGVMGAAIVD